MVYKDYELATSSNRVLEKRSKSNPFTARVIASTGGKPVIISICLLFGASFVGISKYLKDITIRRPFYYLTRFGTAFILAKSISTNFLNILIYGLGDMEEFKYLYTQPEEKRRMLSHVENTDFISSASYNRYEREKLNEILHQASTSNSI